MIIHANVAVDNVINYNNEVFLLVSKVCKIIEKEAYNEKYCAYVRVSSEDSNILNGVAFFLHDKLGYMVNVNDCSDNLFFISWHEQHMRSIERDDYLTAEAACRIARSISKSYNDIYTKINRCIMDYSKKGKGHCSYNVGNVAVSVVEGVKERLLNAGYDVEFNNSRLIIKWYE